MTVPLRAEVFDTLGSVSSYLERGVAWPSQRKVFSRSKMADGFISWSGKMGGFVFVLFARCRVLMNKMYLWRISTGDLNQIKRYSLKDITELVNFPAHLWRRRCRRLGLCGGPALSDPQGGSEIEDPRNEATPPLRLAAFCSKGNPRRPRRRFREKSRGLGRSLFPEPKTFRVLSELGFVSF